MNERESVCVSEGVSQTVGAQVSECERGTREGRIDPIPSQSLPNYVPISSQSRPSRIQVAPQLRPSQVAVPHSADQLNSSTPSIPSTSCTISITSIHPFHTFHTLNPIHPGNPFNQFNPLKSPHQIHPSYHIQPINFIAYHPSHLSIPYPTTHLSYCIEYINAR